MYDLHRLGWHNFQQLCLCITREVLGQTVRSFLDTHDGGRDGAFRGRWKRRASEDLCGKFVIQCKHSTRKDYKLRVSDIADELKKAKRLATRGLCDVYILMTNAGVSGPTEEKLSCAFKEAGVAKFLCYGSAWIQQQIQERKRLRMLVPRLYGLGDLSQILDERAYDQAKVLLASLREDLSKVVLTKTYRQAAAALEKDGFVFLVGGPAAGKTTIAATLTMAAIDQWDVSPMKIDEPSEVTNHWNPHEPSQLFWIDDAFGVAQYDARLVHDWNHIFPQVKAALKCGAKIIMTSRDYIYNRARNDLKHSVFPILKEARIVVDVKALTVGERREILYNHIKLGNQPKEFRSAVKPFLEVVASSTNFLPETARRLGNTFFTRGLVLKREPLANFEDKPEQFLLDVITGLDADSVAALALIYMENGALPSPIQPVATRYEALQRLGSSLGGCTSALSALNDSLVQRVLLEGQPVWVFKHPTIADALAQLLLQNPELLGIYAAGAPAETLMNQVTCGDVGLEGAVVVPPSLFPSLTDRLVSLPENWRTRRRVHEFLAHRCDREFLSRFLAVHPSTYEALSNPGLFLDSSPEVTLAIRLFQTGLLPEDRRVSVVQKVVRYAVEGRDAYVLQDPGLRAMLNAEEQDELLHQIRNELIPRLGEVLTREEEECENQDDPAFWMGTFLDDVLDVLSEEVSGETLLAFEVDCQRKRAQQWIKERETNGEPSDSQPSLAENQATLSPPISARSIFDDVDR